MPEFQIDRFYETLFKSNATEGWLLAGKPPILRIGNQMRELEIPRLTSNDIINVMQSVAGGDNVDLYNKNGMVDFPVIFSDRGMTLEVSMINNAGRCFVLFRAFKSPHSGAARNAGPATVTAKKR